MTERSRTNQAKRGKTISKVFYTVFATSKLLQHPRETQKVSALGLPFVY